MRADERSVALEAVLVASIDKITGVGTAAGDPLSFAVNSTVGEPPSAVTCSVSTLSVILVGLWAEAGEAATISMANKPEAWAPRLARKMPTALAGPETAAGGRGLLLGSGGRWWAPSSSAQGQPRGCPSSGGPTAPERRGAATAGRCRRWHGQADGMGRHERRGKRLWLGKGGKKRKPLRNRLSHSFNI